MTSHYYDENPEVKHNLRTIEYIIDSKKLELTTDAGVFSKSSVDFGSNLLINSIPKCDGTILDMGCGYGPIGLSLAILNPSAKITLADINNRAVELCGSNIISNKIQNAQALQSDSFSKITGDFDIIVCNPPIRTGKKIMYSILEDSYNFLKNQGSLFIVIQKKQGAHSAFVKLNDIFGNCKITNHHGGYQILCSLKDNHSISL